MSEDDDIRARVSRILGGGWSREISDLVLALEELADGVDELQKTVAKLKERQLDK